MQCILFSFCTMIMIVVSVETLFICRFMLLAVWVVAATGIWHTVDLFFYYGSVRIVVYKTQGIFQWKCSLGNCSHFLIKLQSPKLSCFQVFIGGHVLRSQAALVSWGGGGGHYQSGTKPNFGYQLWCLFCNICNVFKNMFSVPLVIMW